MSNSFCALFPVAGKVNKDRMKNASPITPPKQKIFSLVIIFPLPSKKLNAFWVNLP